MHLCVVFAMMKTARSSVMVIKHDGDVLRKDLRGDMQCASNRIVIVYSEGSRALASVYPALTLYNNEKAKDLMASPSTFSGSTEDIDRLVKNMLPAGSMVGDIVHHKAVSSLSSLFTSISEGVALQPAGKDFVLVHELRIDGDKSDENLRRQADKAITTLFNHFDKEGICCRYVLGLSNVESTRRDGVPSPFEGLLARKLAAETSNVAASGLFETGRSLSMYQSGMYLSMTPEIFCGLLTLFVFIIAVILGLQCTNDIKGSSSFTDEKSVPNIGKEA